MTGKKTLKRASSGHGMASVAGVLAVAVLTAVGYSQVRQVPQGHALDANPQVGSGGSNTPVQGYTPINGNDIISGNVTGLAYFHGQGIGSQNVFQGTLGSAALQNFNRTAAGGIPATAGATPGQVYFQSNTVVSGHQGQLYSATTLGGDNNRFIPATSINPAAGVKTNEALIGGRGAVIDLANNADQTELRPNSPGAALTSQLLFTRQGNPILPQVDTTTKEDASKPLVTPNPLQKGDVDQNGNPINNSDTNAQNNTGQSVAGTDGGRNHSLGLQTGERVTGNQEMPGSRTVAMGQGNHGQPQDLGTQAQVSDTYKTLMDDLQKAKAKSEAEAKLAASGNGGTALPPGAAENTANAGNTAVPGIPAGAGATGTNVPGSTAAANGDTTGIPHNPLLDESRGTLRSGQQVPKVESLASIPKGGVATPFDTQLKNAEELMREGKFLDAVDMYQLSLVMQPQNVLATIGKGNAELAAGMYQSAAFDLKSAFTLKPVLIGVHYDLTAVIPTDRLNTLFGDLQKLTTEARSGNTASFLYCYLAYNTDHTNDLQSELNRWGIRPAHDEWQGIAVKAWGK